MISEISNMSEYELDLYRRAVEVTAIDVYLTTELGQAHGLPPADYQTEAQQKLQALVDSLEMDWNVVARDVISAIDHLPEETIAALDVPNRPRWGHHA